MRNSRILGALSLGLALLAGNAAAADHLVPTEVAQQHLEASRDARARDIAVLDTAFSAPEVQAAAEALGVDMSRARAGLGQLSDAELSDLAQRTAALQADPVAGAFTTRQIIWIAGIALAVIIVVAIVA